MLCLHGSRVGDARHEQRHLGVRLAYDQQKGTIEGDVVAAAGFGRAESGRRGRSLLVHLQVKGGQVYEREIVCFERALLSEVIVLKLLSVV